MMEKALKEANTISRTSKVMFSFGDDPSKRRFDWKVKYLTYLKLHRLVTQTSPKRILEALEAGWMSELDEWTNETTVWFSHFICKWRRYLESAYKDWPLARTRHLLKHVNCSTPRRSEMNYQPVNSGPEEFSKTPI